MSNFTMSSRGLGGDASFYKTEAEGQISRPITEGVSYSIAGRGGLLWGLNKPLLFSDRFQLGGPTSVRSFKANGLGPHDGADSVGGDIYYSVGASIISNIPNKPHWPIKTHAWVNAGRLDQVDRSRPLVDNVKDLLVKPSISAGVGLIYRFDPSGDGGLYGELLKNRALQLVTPGTSTAALTGWQALNGATISVIRESTAVSTALPNALQVRIPTGRTGTAGFANTGYSGIKVVSTWKYTASFYYRFPSSTGFNGNIVVGLQTTSGQVLASATVPVSGSQTTWRQATVELFPNATPGNNNNLFTISVDAASAAGQTINFAMLSLFPPTFKNRANGMRIDLAEALAEIRPGLFRFPGGNNLEGQTVERRWQWRKTVGPMVDRPGRMGDWSYVNTDGLGLLEYLYWCEDLGAEPIMGVWAGYALGGTSVAENQLDPYIQEAIDQINFVIGDPARNSAAALRASLGRPQPFKLLYVEIGNEDFFAANSYVYRWRRFVTALQREFPQLRFIATTNPGNPVLTPAPTEYDVHVYQTPTWFAQNVFYYDSFQRNGTKYFEGEYAAISTNPNDLFGSPSNGRLVYPTVQSAVSEAAFMTGLERNADIVYVIVLTAYAPLIGDFERDNYQDCKYWNLGDTLHICVAIQHSCKYWYGSNPVWYCDSEQLA
ncbi:hypothetical protein H1R20_g6135, partial [Candolleomyces eurysporus]